jgi:ribonuclease T1
MKINIKSILILLCILVAGYFAGKYLQKNNKPTTSPTSQSSNSESPERNTTLSYKTTKSKPQQGTIPQKAYDTWHYIQAHHEAPEGYVGGRAFQNREKKLPLKNIDGKRIQYKEWDVNPKINGQNRGAERLVSEGYERAWYTQDHYQTFSELKE